MIIAFRTRVSIEDVFALSIWAMAVLFALFFLYFIVVLFKTPAIDGVTQVREREVSFSGEKIFTGPLALRENKQSPLAIALEQKLSLLSRNTRPDLKVKENVFCIGIRGTDQKKVVKENEPIFLEWKTLETGAIEKVSFSEEGVGVSLIPQVVDDRSLLLKTQEFDCLLKARVELQDNSLNKKDFEALSNAKWWGMDRLFKQYGGTEYGHLGQKQMLEVQTKENDYFLFVGENDFLSFKEGKWVVLSSLEESDVDALLAHVKSVNSKEIELEGWDKNGFLCLDRKLKIQPKEPFRQNPNQMFKEMRMRSSKQVSCQLEKRRVILKEGDWFLKSKSGWHKLRTLSEIEALLNHQMVGELFIIDQIDPKGQLKGNLFDEKRLHMQPISLAIKPQKLQNKPAQRAKRGLPSRK